MYAELYYAHAHTHTHLQTHYYRNADAAVADVRIHHRQQQLRDTGDTAGPLAGGNTHALRQVESFLCSLYNM